MNHEIFINKMKESAKNLTNHFAAIALNNDDSKTFKEHKELWEAKEKVEQALELAISML